MADGAATRPAALPLPEENTISSGLSKPAPSASKLLIRGCCPPTPDPPPPAITVSGPDTSPTTSGQAALGIREKSKRKNEEGSVANQAQPWIVQKLTIFFLVGLLGLATYVYIGRVCVPMIRKGLGALGSRTLGILFLVVFCILWIMFGWAYVKIIFTPPGYARDHVQKTEAPIPGTTSGPPYPSTNASSRQQRSFRHGETRQLELPDEYNSENDSISPYDSDFLNESAQGHAPHRLEPPSSPNTARFGSTLRPPPSTAPRSTPHSSVLPPVLHSRQPPRLPILAEEYRYCQKEGFIKPLRAHHCRMCGTCILNYDHHCPWIGQCVGARNRKFFVIFLFWSMLFTLWTGITLVIVIARAGSRNQDVDALQIVIIALSGLFGIFTAGLLSTHLWMISLNLTTVEHYGIQTMERREETMLDEMFPWWQICARRRAIKRWDEEWGALTTEGNIWWLGGRLANWEATMGKRRIAWFLPIGTCEGDGLSYPTNPRFDPEGRWLRRWQWPSELQ